MTRFFLSLLFLFVAGSSYADRDAYMKLYTIEGSFQNVRDDLQMAIIGRGIKINSVSRIGEMLQRTGKDLGASKEIFAHAEAFEFCSATVSRQAMEADPHNIVFCPYVIAVYSLPGETDKTYISFRRPLAAGGEQPRALQEIERLMAGIVAELTD